MGGDGGRGTPTTGDDPRTISTIVLKGGHYYQVRITPYLQECHWNLEAVNSMLPASADLPDGPTSLPQNQPPDPLTAVVSGEAGSWHPGHALYCLWLWAQRRWRHTKDPSATWRFHLDRRQQLEAIAQHKRTMKSPGTGNLCPVLRSTRSWRWRWADNCCPPSALRRKPEQRTQPLCTMTSVPSAAPSCDVWGTLQGPNPPRAKHGNTATRTREATTSGLPRCTQHGARMPCPLRPVTGSGRAPNRHLLRRYPERMAHGPEACEASHLCGSR